MRHATGRVPSTSSASAAVAPSSFNPGREVSVMRASALRPTRRACANRLSEASRRMSTVEATAAAAVSRASSSAAVKAGPRSSVSTPMTRPAASSGSEQTAALPLSSA